MFTARRKIQKAKGVDPTEFEDTVAQVSGSPPSPVFHNSSSAFG
jgi:hypothetical protein